MNKMQVSQAQNPGARARQRLLAMAVSLTVTLVASLMLAAASHAAADLVVTFAGPFTSPGDGEARHNNRIAVEYSSGNVLKTDPVNDRIVVYVPVDSGADELTTFGAGDLTDPFGIAIDQSTGDVYVSDASGVSKFISDGQATPTYIKDSTFSIAGVTGALAFDQPGNHLLVADNVANVVRRYSTVGVAAATFDGSAGAGSPGAFTGLQDLAIDSTGDIVVVDALGGDPADGAISHVERYASNGVWEATIGPVDGAATVGVVPATDKVVVSGNQAAINTNGTPTVFVFDAHGSMQYVVDAQYATVSGIAADDGLTGRLYIATDTCRGPFFAGFYGLASLQIFNAPVPPTAQTTAVTGVKYNEATVHGVVNPGRDETTYHFEYGTTTAYGASTSDTSAGADLIDNPVSAQLSGLQPSTVYHYRLVANNDAGGPVASADQTFTTAEPPPDVTTGAVSDVGQNTATVAGTVDTHGLAGTFRITVIQTEGVYSDQTAPVALQAVHGPQAVQAQLANLPAGRTFTARVAATTAGGQRFGTLASFSTRPLSNYLPQPVSPAENGDWFTGLQSHPFANPTQPSNRFTFNSKVNGATAILTAEVPAKGLLTVRGSGLAGATRHLADKGTVRLTVRLTKAARKALYNSKTGRLKVQVTVRYTPTGGTLNTATRTVTFKRGGNG